VLVFEQQLHLKNMGQLVYLHVDQNKRAMEGIESVKKEISKNNKKAMHQFIAMVIGNELACM
jgi:hypothetical protein